jgi:hypothetical protein
LTPPKERKSFAGKNEGYGKGKSRFQNWWPWGVDVFHGDENLSDFRAGCKIGKS